MKFRILIGYGYRDDYYTGYRFGNISDYPLVSYYFGYGYTESE